MTVSEQNSALSEFFAGALNIMRDKGRDYAPDDIALFDLVCDSVNTGVSPDQGLFFFLQKHVTAIRHQCAHGVLFSERYEERLRDAANFLGLMYTLVRYRTSVYQTIYAKLHAHTCTPCVAPCDTCNTLVHLLREMDRYGIDKPTVEYHPELPWIPSNS